jgi:hypothetical protein
MSKRSIIVAKYLSEGKMFETKVLHKAATFYTQHTIPVSVVDSETIKQKRENLSEL